MILILLLELRNLKNIIKLTITITATIIMLIVIIMKAITTIKVVMIIKLIAPHHQPQKKLFSYLETAWQKN